ncbi:histidine phosphatase family protein [Paenibacillus sp. VCA1]|uniref:histidine phosphatase family protein n=1 Tax=Paenibacillus sp. VCA1 TaxID=3039148 RepID=UPI00287284F0|nr:histidine phosphatase family protein [Paenibacillus sp. VCA1]MDR9853891.1 histidine phosphatase family protein [Paenibacillus sp. VCA1]
MRTYIYMVRHGDSPKTEGTESTRGLTEKRRLDARRVTELLREEGIGVFVSSPYARSVMTIQELADRAGQEMIVHEDLKERRFSASEYRMSDEELYPLLERSFADPFYALEGGESNDECQRRAIRVLEALLEEHRGRKVAIGTHGAVMTLMMGHYDSRRYGLDFLHRLSKPDIYRMEFRGQELVDVKRLWSETADA